MLDLLLMSVCGLNTITIRYDMDIFNVRLKLAGIAVTWLSVTRMRLAHVELFLAVRARIRIVVFRLIVSCFVTVMHFWLYFYYSTPVGERSIAISLSVCLCVCLSVCPRAYLRNRWTDLYDFIVPISCGHGSVLLRRRCDYVMYFRFYKWRHVWP